MTVVASHFSLTSVVRPNIRRLQPYRCARDDYSSGILLDANENSFGHSLPQAAASAVTSALRLNRYPDPSFDDIKTEVATFRNIPAPDWIFLGVGSDEVIDLLIRITCIPGRDHILITPPTYGMYAVCAEINDVEVTRCPLTVGDDPFKLQIQIIQSAITADPSIKLIFICSPGNPTGTLIPINDIKALLDFPGFTGLVIVDEAYIDFAPSSSSAVELVKSYPNLCVLQTLSKSFGLAAIRLGIAIAQPPLIRYLSNTKAPYNISSLTAEIAKAAVSPEGVQLMRTTVAELCRLRQELCLSFAELKSLGIGDPVGQGHANFILLPVLKRNGTSLAEYDNERSQRVYRRLAEEMGVVVRYRGGEVGCGGCLRITVGTPEENAFLLQCLRKALEDI